MADSYRSHHTGNHEDFNPRRLHDIQFHAPKSPTVKALGNYKADVLDLGPKTFRGVKMDAVDSIFYLVNNFDAAELRKNPIINSYIVNAYHLSAPYCPDGMHRTQALMWKFKPEARIQSMVNRGFIKVVRSDSKLTHDRWFIKALECGETTENVGGFDLGGPGMKSEKTGVYYNSLMHHYHWRHQRGLLPTTPNGWLQMQGY